MRLFLTLILLACPLGVLAGGYDLPTDLVIESDCDIVPVPTPEPITVKFSL